MTNLLIISNGPMVVISSNANSFAFSYSTTYAPGPWLWPVVWVVGGLLAWGIWSGLRRGKS